MPKFVFYIPIYNLNLENLKSINFNSNVKLLTFTNYQKNNILILLKKLISNNPNYKDNKSIQKEIFEYYRKDLDKFVNKTCIRVEINDKNRENALNRAIEFVNQFINVLKLYRYPNDCHYRRYFGIEGEMIEKGYRKIYLIEDYKNLGGRGETVGPLMKFNIDKVRLEYMKKNKFKKILNMIENKQKSDLDKKILSAINWYGESFNSNSVRYNRNESSQSENDLNKIHNTKRFLNCIIALESLFVGKNETNIKENLAKRFAFLMSDEYHHRCNGYERIKKLYDLRCEIVHEGKTHISQKDLKNSFEVTKYAILGLLHRKERLGFKCFSDFQKWCKKQELK